MKTAKKFYRENFPICGSKGMGSQQSCGIYYDPQKLNIVTQMVSTEALL